MSITFSSRKIADEQSDVKRNPCAIQQTVCQMPRIANPWITGDASSEKNPIPFMAAVGLISETYRKTNKFTRDFRFNYSVSTNSYL